MELRKAAVVFRKMLAAEPVPMIIFPYQKNASKSLKLADVQTLLMISSVCRYWSCIFATCQRKSLQQLRRSFTVS
jgi:hypothetical protein